MEKRGLNSWDIDGSKREPVLTDPYPPMKESNKIALVLFLIALAIISWIGAALGWG